MLFMILVIMTLPGDMNDASIRMIIPGIVYEDSLVFQQGQWMGLFVPDSGGCMLRPVELDCRMDQDPLCDWERPAGLIVTTPQEPERPMILLMSVDSVFTQGPVDILVGNDLLLPPDTSIVLHSDSMTAAELRTSESGLFITCGQLEQNITETFPGSGPSAPCISIIWAGDLDRDGQVDLLLNDLDDSYNWFCWDLYLSGAAPSGQLLKKVARFYDVYY